MRYSWRRNNHRPLHCNDHVARARLRWLRWRWSGYIALSSSDWKGNFWRKGLWAVGKRCYVEVIELEARWVMMGPRKAGGRCVVSRVTDMCCCCTTLFFKRVTEETSVAGYRHQCSTLPLENIIQRIDKINTLLKYTLSFMFTGVHSVINWN